MFVPPESTVGETLAEFRITSIADVSEFRVVVHAERYIDVRSFKLKIKGISDGPKIIIRLAEFLTMTKNITSEGATTLGYEKTELHVRH